MALKQISHKNHPMIKVGALGVVAVVAAFFALSIIVGAFWTLMKLALLLLVVAGVFRLVRHSFHRS
jgi:uncharacterized membrane protein